MSVCAGWFRKHYDYCPTEGLFWRVKNGSRLNLVGHPTTDGYIAITIKQKPYRAHRLAWLHFHGEWPALAIDHINGVKHDNRLCNLRLATTSQNNANKLLSLQNKSGAKGISWDEVHQKWQVFISINGRNKNLGVYPDFEQAKVAYKIGAMFVFGEFANTGERP